MYKLKHLSIVALCLILTLSVLFSCDKPDGTEDKTSEKTTTQTADVDNDDKETNIKDESQTDEKHTNPPDTKPPKPETTSPAVTSKKVLTVLDSNVSSYYIIGDSKASPRMAKSTANFKNKLDVVSATPFVLKTDAELATRYEILLGNTNRPETKEVLKTLPENGYAVAVKNSKLVIVGTDEDMTTLAMYEFAQRVFTNTNKYSKGRIEIYEEDCFTENREYKLQLSDIIKNNYKYDLTTERIITCKTSWLDPHRNGQGATSDGTYVYIAMRKDHDESSVIHKFRLDTGEKVKESKPIYLGHANDLTYDFARKVIVVAHGQKEGNTLTLVNPDTLEIIKDQYIPHGAGAITYSKEKDIYAISQGGKSLYTLTSEFYHKSGDFGRGSEVSTGYTAQGMGSDERYIYFPMSGKNDNIMQVYDWFGRYKGRIVIDLPYESESMFWVDGTYYIAMFEPNRAKLYCAEYIYRIDCHITFEF